MWCMLHFANLSVGTYPRCMQTILYQAVVMIQWICPFGYLKDTAGDVRILNNCREPQTAASGVQSMGHRGHPVCWAFYCLGHSSPGVIIRLVLYD